MNGKRVQFLLIISVLFAVTLACNLGVSQAIKPTVVITFPQSETNVIVGQELIVQSVAVDAKGVTRIEFLVNGQPVDSQMVDPPSTSYTANQPWAPEVPGRYVLQMQAYNLDDEPSEPAQVVVTVTERTAQPLAAGSATPEIGATGSVTPVPGTISDESSGGPLVTALVDLNVRAGPGVEYPAVGALLAGQSAPIVGKNAGGTWWQVTYKPGVTPGWVSGNSRYSTSANFEGVPVVEAPPPPTATPTPTDTPTPTATATATPTPRKIVTYGLTADKDVILIGESVVLRWNLREITSAYLLYNGLEEKVVIPGNKTFYPTKTTTYTLVTRDEAGEETVIAQLTLKVIDATATPIPVLRDGKTRIVDGQMIDFDQGIIYQGEGDGIDFYWDGKSKQFVPETGSAVALLDMPFDEITLTACRFAPYRETVPETQSSAEVAGCYLTGEGRYGKFLVSEWDSAGNLTVQWLTWDYR